MLHSHVMETGEGNRTTSPSHMKAEEGKEIRFEQKHSAQMAFSVRQRLRQIFM